MFLVIPLDRKPDWRNPPLVTLALIIVNTLVYLFWQHSDYDYLVEAYSYYEESGLYRIELEHYKSYRQTHAPLDASTELSESEEQQLIGEMIRDGRFQKRLEDEQIITPNDDTYQEWKEKRKQFDWYLDHVVQIQYGSNPSRPSLLTSFTSMFLHGSFGHLLGNMVFLFLMGFVVEIVLGRWIYLAGYLLAGLAGDGLFIWWFADYSVPGVGASGAVSGVMAMYLVLFGLRKIRFFYQFLFYFDYVKAPAIILAPAWILWQLYIEFFMDTNINVAAHLGGFVGGAVIALLAKRFGQQVNTDYLDERINQEAYEKDFQRGQELLAAMKLEEAQRIFEQLYEQYPTDTAILQQLFNIAKFNPATDAYHRYAQKLLNMPGSDQRTVKLLHDVFKDYSNRAKPSPRLSADLLMSLALRFAASQYIEDAEKIVLYLLKRKRDFTRNAEGISALAKHYRNKNTKKFEYYRQLLLKFYPDSDEAVHLQQAARGL